MWSLRPHLVSASSTHCSHCRLNHCIWLHGLQGCLKGSQRLWDPLQAGHYPPQSLGTGWLLALVPETSCEGESHSACLTCKHSSALWGWALLASEPQWQCLCLNSPKAGEACPVVVTGQEWCNIFSQLGNWFGGASIFACSSCSIWGVVSSLRGSLMGAASSMVTYSVGTSVKAGGASLEVIN